MVTGEAISVTAENLTDLAREIGTIGNWLQAIGIIVIFWIIFQIVNWAINKRRLDKLNKIQKKLHEIENKIDKIITKKK